MRPLLAVLLLTASLAACATTPPAPLPLTEVARGLRGGCVEPRREVVRDAERWRAVWAQLQDPSATPPTVDFATQQLLVVCLGERRTGGHAIEIVAATVGAEATGGQALIVTLRTRRPAPGAITTQAFTQPFHVVAVARSTLPVRWVDEAKE